MKFLYVFSEKLRQEYKDYYIHNLTFFGFISDSMRTYFAGRSQGGDGDWKYEITEVKKITIDGITVTNTIAEDGKETVMGKDVIAEIGEVVIDKPTAHILGLEAREAKILQIISNKIVEYETQSGKTVAK